MGLESAKQPAAAHQHGVLAGFEIILHILGLHADGSLADITFLDPVSHLRGSVSELRSMKIDAFKQLVVGHELPVSLAESQHVEDLLSRILGACRGKGSN